MLPDNSKPWLLTASKFMILEGEEAEVEAEEEEEEED